MIKRASVIPATVGHERRGCTEIPSQIHRSNARFPAPLRHGVALTREQHHSDSGPIAQCRRALELPGVFETMTRAARGAKLQVVSDGAFPLLANRAHHPARIVRPYNPDERELDGIVWAGIIGVPLVGLLTVGPPLVSLALGVTSIVFFFVVLSLSETYLRRRNGFVEFYRPIGVIRRFRPRDMAVWTAPDPDDPTGTYWRVLLHAYEQPRLQLEIVYAPRAADSEAFADHLAGSRGIEREGGAAKS
jgi:hypothetical protein